MRLGRQPRPHNARVLRLRDYAPVALPPAPASWDGTPGATIAMYGNDRYGCCTKAAVANLAGIQSAGDGLPIGFTEKDVVADYFDQSGGEDSGLVVVDVLARTLKRGFPLDGRWRLRAWAGVEHADLDELRAAAALFQGVYLGVELPDDWQVGADRGSWDVTGPPNPDNGHALVLGGYDAGGAALVTWGKVVRATWAWLERYVVEGYALLDETRCAVDVLRGEALVEDLAALARETGAGA